MLEFGIWTCILKIYHRYNSSLHISRVVLYNLNEQIYWICLYLHISSKIDWDDIYLKNIVLDI